MAPASRSDRHPARQDGAGERRRFRPAGTRPAAIALPVDEIRRLHDSCQRLSTIAARYLLGIGTARRWLPDDDSRRPRRPCTAWPCVAR
jgi:hypothetical protein